MLELNAFPVPADLHTPFAMTSKGHSQVMGV